MTDLNAWAGIGRLGRDAELKYSNTGLAICRFSVCCNTSRKEEGGYVDKANWFDVTYLGKGAEAVNQYLVKGKQVAIMGRLEQDTWEKDGVKHSKVAIVAESVQLLGGKAEGGESSPGGSGSGGQGAGASAGASRGAPPAKSGGDLTDDIPF